VVKNIVMGFLKCLDELKNENLLSDNSLRKYPDYSVHSYFQYCLIISAHHGGLRGIPEYKLRLSKPIDKYLIDSRLKNRKIKYMRSIKVDVGFLKEGKLVGIGEIYTPDEIHGCLPSKELEKPWITPYDKLVHIAKYEDNVKFIVLVVGLWTLPLWRDAKKKTLQEWYECWKRLVELILSKKEVAVMYIKGLGKIEITP